MPKQFSSTEIIKILEQEGFEKISQKGSHIKMRKTLTDSEILTTIIPAGRKNLPIGTLLSISRQTRIMFR